jgi:hypothetical protein
MNNVHTWVIRDEEQVNYIAFIASGGYGEVHKVTLFELFTKYVKLRKSDSSKVILSKSHEPMITQVFC